MNGQIRRQSFALVPVCVAALTLSGTAWATPPAKKYSSIFKKATVFRDANGNMLLDPGEKTSATREDGSFAPPAGKKGALVLKGGINVVTGAPNVDAVALDAKAPAGKKAPQGGEQIWPKYDQTKAFNLLTNLWKVLTLPSGGGLSGQVAGDVLGQWADCVGGNCIDTTPDRQKNPRNLDRANRQMWENEAQLTVLKELAVSTLTRAQGGLYGSQSDGQAAVNALALALLYVWSNNGQAAPNLLSQLDIAELLATALQYLEPRNRDYLALLPQVGDLAFGLNQAFDQAVRGNQTTFERFQALQVVAHKAALGLADNLDAAALRECYSGDGLERRIADPELACRGDAICVLPDPSTLSRTVDCPSGQAGAIVEIRTASCPNANGAPVWSDWIATSNTCQAQTLDRPPVAAAQSLTATAGVALPITLSASDPDGDKLTYGIAAFPVHGALGGTPPNLTYTAAAGYSGQDSFTFKANDGKADSLVATVTITVKAACVLPNPATETRTLNCPSADQTGARTQTRTASCPNPGGSPVWSDWTTTADTCQTPAASGSEPKMVRLTGGTFQMGSPPGEAGRVSNETRHAVTVGSFSIGKYEVTQGQWKAVMGNNPSSFSSCGDDCPVENVSWNDAQDYIAALNRQTGKRYRLPTEAEWEYACRSGGAVYQKYCGSNNVEEVAWYFDNSGGKTHPVGGKVANAFGLYDMSGNVFEWTCSDYIASYDGHELTCIHSANNPRAGRGGSWAGGPVSVRAANRGYDPAWDRGDYVGFRLAQD